MTSFSIAQLCASYQGGEDFFPRFQALARQFDGVRDIAILAAGERPDVHGPEKFFASAPIRHLDEVVGEVHMFFDPARFQERSPLPLVKYLAKQLGIAIQAAAVHQCHAALRQHLAGLEGEIHEHKLLERARGVIESRKLIPAGEGQRLMRKVSAQSGKTLRDVAQGIVAAANKRKSLFVKRLQWPHNSKRCLCRCL